MVRLPGSRGYWGPGGLPQPKGGLLGEGPRGARPPTQGGLTVGGPPSLPHLRGVVWCTRWWEARPNNRLWVLGVARPTYLCDKASIRNTRQSYSLPYNKCQWAPFAYNFLKTRRTAGRRPTVQLLVLCPYKPDSTQGRNFRISYLSVRLFIRAIWQTPTGSRRFINT